MTDQHETTESTGAEEEGPFRTYEAEDGTFVVYDHRRADAYVRSDVTVEIRR